MCCEAASRSVLASRSRRKAPTRQALRLDPEDLYVRRRLLRIALDRHRTGACPPACGAVAANDDASPEHHFLAGMVAAADSRRDEARMHYGNAIARADGNYPEAYFNLGLLEKAAGRSDASIAAYRRAIELRPDYATAMNNLALVLTGANRDEEAIVLYQRALAIASEIRCAWFNLGKLHLAAPSLR